MGGTQRLLEVGVVPASAEVAEALQLGLDAPVVRRPRLILRDGEPIEVAVSYWPAGWAAETALAQPRKIQGGSVRLVADLGWVFGRSIEDVGAELADGDNVPQAPVGVALFVLLRTMLDTNGTPYEYQTNHSWDGHRQRYVLELV